MNRSFHFQWCEVAVHHNIEQEDVCPLFVKVRTSFASWFAERQIGPISFWSIMFNLFSVLAGYNPDKSCWVGSNFWRTQQSSRSSEDLQHTSRQYVAIDIFSKNGALAPNTTRTRFYEEVIIHIWNHVISGPDGFREQRNTLMQASKRSFQVMVMPFRGQQSSVNFDCFGSPAKAYVATVPCVHI